MGREFLPQKSTIEHEREGKQGLWRTRRGYSRQTYQQAMVPVVGWFQVHGAGKYVARWAVVRSGFILVFILGGRQSYLILYGWLVGWLATLSESLPCLKTR